MKSLVYFLIISTNLVTLSNPTKLDVDFFFKQTKANSNRRIESKAHVFVDANGMATLECGVDSDFILNFNVQDQNGTEVKIRTEIFDGATLIAKPVITIPYNQKGVIEIGTNGANAESSEFSLSIIPSQEILEPLEN